MNVIKITDQFESGQLDAKSFQHSDHLAVAFGLLRKYEFSQAANTCIDGIRALAAAAGATDKFNLTITYAYLSLLAERLATHPSDDFEQFIELNPDLVSSARLGQWYSHERLHSPLARQTFLLPDRLPQDL